MRARTLLNSEERNEEVEYETQICTLTSLLFEESEDDGVATGVDYPPRSSNVGSKKADIMQQASVNTRTYKETRRMPRYDMCTCEHDGP